MVRRGNIFDSCLQTLQSGAQIPILKSTIAMRNGFPSRSSMAAWSVRKSAASTEDALVDEISNLLEIKVSKRKIKMNIKKGDMAARAALAAKSAPTIGDRLRHAQDLVHTHPADETAFAASAPQAWVRRPLRLALPCRPSRPARIGRTLRESRTELIDVNLITHATSTAPNGSANWQPASRARPGDSGLAAKQGGRHVLAAGHYRLRAPKLIGAKPWT
jgi:hypothetical protein